METQDDFHDGPNVPVLLLCSAVCWFAVIGAVVSAKWLWGLAKPLRAHFGF